MGQIHSYQSESISFQFRPGLSSPAQLFTRHWSSAVRLLGFPGGISPQGNRHRLPAAVGFGCRLSAAVGCCSGIVAVVVALRAAFAGVAREAVGVRAVRYVSFSPCSAALAARQAMLPYQKCPLQIAPESI